MVVLKHLRAAKAFMWTFGQEKNPELPAWLQEGFHLLNHLLSHRFLEKNTTTNSWEALSMAIKIHLRQIKKMMWPSLCYLNYNLLQQILNIIYFFSWIGSLLVKTIVSNEDFRSTTSQNKHFKFVIQYFTKKA